tara:strand:- start:155 stop:1279 length:1125 start_codon:yes stop_codon:yes gene_type:complete
MDELNELDKLLFSIFAPLFLVIPIVVLLYSTRHEDREIWSFGKYFRTFDAKHGLGSQPLFAIAIVYPIGLFFSTGIWAWSGLVLELSADGFNQFIEISKLPLGLLALSLPLAVLTARLHGTKQTALQIMKSNDQITNTLKQISETQQKNKTDLYLSHYKYFSECILEIETTWQLEDKEINTLNNKTPTVNKKRCHHYLYPDASLTNGIGTITSEGFDTRINELIEIINEAIVLLESKSNNKKQFRDFFVISSKRFSDIFNVGFFNEKANNIFIPRGGFPKKSFEVCYFSSIKNLMGIFCFFEEVLHKIYNFDVIHDQKSSSEFQKRILHLAKLTVSDECVHRDIEIYLNRGTGEMMPRSSINWIELDSYIPKAD